MNPCDLIDCFNCDGQLYPDQRYCSFCKADNWTEERVQMEFQMQFHEEKEYVQYLLEEKN